MGKTELNIEEVVKKHEEGLSYNKLSLIFNESASSLQKKVIQYKEQRYKKIGPRERISEDVKDEIIYRYLYEKKGLIATGAPWGLSQKRIETVLKERGVQKRTYIEAKQIQRKYEVNDDFFKHQSSEMAYILGFLAADGFVSSKENRISIQLQESDQDFLEKIKELIQSDRPIKNYLTNAGRSTCKLEVWSSEWKKDLAIYNIVPNKTFILMPPDRLDSQYYFDYIRGYFDGDGSIYVNLNKYKNEFKIIGASYDLITWMYNQFIEQGINISFKTFFTDHNVKMYEVISNNKQTIKKIYQLFYTSENVFCLQRKRQKFELIV